MNLNQVLDSCDSTNTVAKQWGEQGAPHGSWVSARTQTDGRGRQGREWISREGNLFLSLIVRPKQRSLWTWIPLVTALAVVTELHKRWPGLDVRIKWPNDLWVDGKKIGGILCEGVGAGAGNSFVVIGLGLNCVSSPQKIDQPTLALSDAIGQEVTADQIREAIKDSIMRSIDQMSEWGIKGLIQSYEECAAFPAGSEIEWSDGRGVVVGLGESGELNVIDYFGREQRLLAEDIRKLRGKNSV